MDSPNIDFGQTVDFNASQRKLPLVPFNVPPTLTAVAKFITSLRIGVNWIRSTTSTGLPRRSISQFSSTTELMTRRCRSKRASGLPKKIAS